MYYIISLPFLVIGIINSFKQKNIKINIIHFWIFSASLILCFFEGININRINIIIFPLLYFIINGLYIVTSLKINKKNTIFIPIIISIAYLISFLGFGMKYVKVDNNGYTFANDVEEVIKYVDSLDVDNIYFEYAFKEPYIYVLYYNQTSSKEFISTVKYFNDKSKGFDNIKEFEKYHFYLPEGLEIENSAYVIKKENSQELDYSQFKIKEFEKYIVLESK